MRKTCFWTSIGLILLVFNISFGQSVISSSQELTQALLNGGEYRLEAGHYELSEIVTVTNDLSLMGAGMDETFISSAAELDLLPIRGAVKIYFEGITFARTGQLRGGVVDIEDAAFEIINCRFTGGVYLEPTEEDALFYGSGLSLNGTAKGTVTTSIFEANENDGVHLEEFAELVIEDSHIKGNSGGIVTFGDTRVEAKGNHFEHNDLDGLDSIAVYAQDNVSFLLTDNTFTSNIGGSIFALGNAHVVAKANHFNNGLSEYDAIIVGEEATLELTNNLIINHPAGALYAYDDAHIVLANNTIETGGSESDMVLIADRVKAELKRNIFTNNAGIAFTALDDTSVILIANTFEANQGWTAVYLGGSSVSELKANQIVSNTQIGLFVEDAALANVSSNLIAGNGEDGVQARSNAQLTLTLNTIRSNGWDGVYLDGQASAYLAANTIQKNSQSAIRLTEEAFASVFENKLNDNGEDGIDFFAESRGFVSHNVLHNNNWNGVALGDNSYATIKQNQLTGNILRGLLFMDESQGYAFDNIITASTHGIFIAGDAAPHLLNNTFSDNETDVDTGSLIRSNRVASELFKMLK